MIKALITADKAQKLALSVSHTTRSIRPGEEPGKHYHFVDPQTFEAMVDNNEMYEWAKVFGNYYGTSIVAIEQLLQQGKDVFLDIDWQGARQVKKIMPSAVSVFIAPPSKQALLSRLRGRNQDSEQVIAQRMAEAKDEISHYHEFDYIVINDVFDTAVADFSAIIQAQRLTQVNQITRNQPLFSQLLS